MPTAVDISNELHLQLSEAETIIVIRWHIDGRYTIQDTCRASQLWLVRP